MARASKYETHIVPNLGMIREMRERGVDLRDIAKSLNVHVSTLLKYAKDNSELNGILKNAKMIQEDQMLRLAEAGILSRLEARWEVVERTREVKQLKDKDGNLIQTFAHIVYEKERLIEPSDTILIFTAKNLNPAKWDATNHDITLARKKKVEVETARLESGDDIGQMIADKLNSYSGERNEE
jgi:transcriptional regulator with XRE-family HTH domain